MPTYNYHCQDCGKEFDIQATLEEKEEQDHKKFSCPQCQSKNIKQQFSAVSFLKNVFKDDGKNSGGCCSGGNCQCG